MPTKHQRVKAFIYAVRQSHPKMEAVFTQGACLHFYHMLRCAFPRARGYYKTSHVITEVGGRFYDITGQVLRPRERGYKPFSELNPRRVASTWKHTPHCTPSLMPKSSPILNTGTMAAIRRGLDLQERFPVGSRVCHTEAPEDAPGTVAGHEPDHVYVHYDSSDHDLPVATNPENLKIMKDPPRGDSLTIEQYGGTSPREASHFGTWQRLRMREGGDEHTAFLCKVEAPVAWSGNYGADKATVTPGSYLLFEEGKVTALPDEMAEGILDAADAEDVEERDLPESTH